MHTMMPLPSTLNSLQGLTLLRSTRRRRSIALVRQKNGEIALQVPHTWTDKTLQAHIVLHQAWIQRTLARYRTRPVYHPKTYLPGESFLYLGESYTLHQDTTLCCPSIRLIGKELWVSTQCPDTPDATFRKLYLSRILKRWYYRQAKQYLVKKTQCYTERLGLTYRSITIGEYKSRWGSCSISGELTYNWRIILSPSAVVDYLVAHEVAHLRHPNHSHAFWSTVAQLSPDYRTHRTWLRQQGDFLRID